MLLCVFNGIFFEINKNTTKIKIENATLNNEKLYSLKVGVMGILDLESQWDYEQTLEPLTLETYPQIINYFPKLLLANLLTLLSGETNIYLPFHPDEIAYYRLDPFLSVYVDNKLQKEGTVAEQISLAEKNGKKPTFSAKRFFGLQKFLNQHVGFYQKDVLSKNFFSFEYQGTIPIDILPLEKGLQAIRQSIWALYQKYEDEFSFHLLRDSVLSKEAGLFESLWYLVMQKEIQLKDGRIKILPAFQSDMIVTLAVACGEALEEENPEAYEGFILKDGFVFYEGKKVAFPRNGIYFQILQFLLSRKRSATHMEICRTVNPRISKSVQKVKGYMRRCASKMRQKLKACQRGVKNENGRISLFIIENSSLKNRP